MYGNENENGRGWCYTRVTIVMYVYADWTNIKWIDPVLLSKLYSFM